MHYIMNHIDTHAEVWGAVVFGILAIASCIALAAAFNGIL